MSDFYVTLDSGASVEFPGNTAAAFQRRLPTLLNLTRGKWKVGMTSLVLPDMDAEILIGSMDKDSVIADMELSYKTDSSFATNSIKIKQEDIVSKVGSAPTPRQVMQVIVDMYNVQKIKKSDDLYIWTIPSHPTLNRLDLTFKWQNNGDLLLDNGVVYLGSLGPYAIFDVFFALKMGWIIKTTNGYQLGPNLSYNMLKHTDGSDRKATDLDAICIGSGLDSRPLNSYWGIYKNTQMYLSIAANWTFVFRQKQHLSQLIQVHSNIVKSSIVNNTIRSLLSQIIYKREGLGLVYIEPRIIHYIDVALPLLEIISVTLLDSVGSPAHLEGGNTTITLHFTRES